MSRKTRRRGFEIEAPKTPAPRATLVGEARRGPMATAIAETSAALDNRRAAEDAIRAENDALAAAQARARRLGVAVELIPLDQISTTKLIRDRHLAAVDEDLDELKASLQAIGLSNPIRVEAAEGGPYQLIQGLRRLSAYRALYAETGDQAWSAIPAALTPAGETVEGLYRRMVDENLMRKDVSFAEMALLARAYAAEGAGDLGAAVKTLFASAGAQKRSYIRAFAELMAVIGDHLEHPQAIPRQLGLTLRARLSEPGFTETLETALTARPPGRTAAEELALLRRLAAEEPPKPSPRGKAPASETRVTLPRPKGEATCRAAPSRVEIRAPEDFSAYPEADLKRALAAFYAALEV